MNGQLLAAVKDIHIDNSHYASYQESYSRDGESEINSVEYYLLISGSQLVDGAKVQRLAGTLSVTHRQEQSARVEYVTAGIGIPPP